MGADVGPRALEEANVVENEASDDPSR